MIKFISSIWPILPQLLIAITALMLLMTGVFQGKKNSSLITYTAVLSLVAASLATLAKPLHAGSFGFTGFLTQNLFTDYMQILILLTTAVVLLATHRQLEKDEMNRFEYPVLILLSCLGMLFMVAANDFMMFFIGLELQSLAIYVLVAMRRNRVIVGEAAVKYFLLGILSTVFILYGISFIYGFAGTTSFYGVSVGLETLQWSNPLVFAMFLLMVGLAFKLSLAPFHMWAPDVYEGSPTVITLFIASAPKVAALAFFVRLLNGPLSQYSDVWQPAVQVLAIISMVVGVFGALFQKNLKRLLAYSTIANMGYMMLGVASIGIEGIQSLIVYIVLYVIMTVGTFAFILNLRINGEMIQNIDELKGLSKDSPKMAMAFAILLFSLAGIPPLAGFFAKLLVFIAAINAGLYPLVIVAVLTTVVGAAYYLRIIKIMYFDKMDRDEKQKTYDLVISRETAVILTIAAAFNVLFFFWPGPLILKAEDAAAVIFER
ncbi:MAG: NADH-quinone oxidoreductase subunit NuoN [Alphaproteobacteria bacterium]|nr:NADH-quinone oxidoreductase subunit NuoN [Alphaproteobacteria bacterium]